MAGQLRGSREIAKVLNASTEILLLNKIVSFNACYMLAKDCTQVLDTCIRTCIDMHMH